MNNIEQTKRTKPRRFRQRVSFDRDRVNEILDSSIAATVGFVHDGLPAVLPMVYWRTGNHVYFHGASKNRMFLSLVRNSSCCFVVHNLDALVLAKAAIHHSVNYRSVIIYGQAEEVAHKDEKCSALQHFIERLYPGRWADIRPPNIQELKAVNVFRIAIEECSAKLRSGFPTPYEEDADIPVWTGIVPLNYNVGQAVRDPNDLKPLEEPAYISGIDDLFK